jgi:hypothetical protein
MHTEESEKRFASFFHIKILPGQWEKISAPL